MVHSVFGSKAKRPVAWNDCGYKVRVRRLMVDGF